MPQNPAPPAPPEKGTGDGPHARRRATRGPLSAVKPSRGPHGGTSARRGGQPEPRRVQTRQPSPKSQSLSRSYGSVLPTSLTYIVLSTRGCSPWRPAAVMSTAGRENDSFPSIFKGRQGHSGRSRNWSALPVIQPYLWLTQFQGRQESGRTPHPPHRPHQPREGPTRNGGGEGGGHRRNPALTVKKKRELFPEPLPPFRSSVALPQAYPRPGSGILT